MIQTFALILAAAPVPFHPAAVDVYTMSAGRIGATAAAVLALIGVIIGVLALVRPTGRFGTASGRLGAIVALATGLIGMAIGAFVVANSAGGIGTGNGRGGAIVAVVLGLIAVAVGGFALAQSRRIG